MEDKIDLEYGKHGEYFLVQDLINHIKSTPRNYIVLGAQVCVFAIHSKPSSFDYWLRQKTKLKDVKQSCRAITHKLLETGLFEFNKMQCPDSGIKCNALILKPSVK
jgi:hypothetical protein